MSHAYSFNGKHLFKCRPLMKEGRVGRTVLDCIFSRVTNTFYILDVLIWADHPLMDCEVSGDFMTIFSMCFLYGLGRVTIQPHLFY